MPETACSCCQGDPLTVCDACGEHSCWAGRFMCENAGTVGTRYASADELAEAALRRFAARFADDPGAPGSPAAALVWAVRVLDERGREMERLRAELGAAQAAIGRVREQHQREVFGKPPCELVCCGPCTDEHLMSWPCPTIAALDDDA